MARLIKVHDNVYESLESLKKDNETFSEVVFRLILLHIILLKVVKETPNNILS